jgi:hypothetical protein
MLPQPEDFKAAPALVAIAVLAMAALFSPPSQAAPRALSEHEMSDVRGADGSAFAGVPAAPGSPSNGFAMGLAAAFSSSTGASVLDAAEFGAALQAAGWPAGAPLPGYAGQPVQQTRVDAAPVTFSVDLSTVLQAGTGLAYQGPSMGTITLRDFDARGTTLWAWHHP